MAHHTAMAGAALAALLVLGALLGGCSRHDPDGGDAPRQAGADSRSLPVPEHARGSITGMPSVPGPGAGGASDRLTADVSTDADADGDGDGDAIPPDAPPGQDGADAGTLPGETGADSGRDATLGEGSAEAIAVIADYYTMLGNRSFGHAYRLWSDGGRASGRSPQQFADIFADTAGIAAVIMTPGRIDAAARAHYIEVPVAVTETRRDGSERRYAGAYTLRHEVGEAMIEQRAWRISSADLREVRP